MSCARGWLPEATASAATPDPPLRIWLAPALVLLACLAASLVSFARHDDQFLRYNGGRIAALAAAPPAVPSYRVVALGDSRLKHATLNETELAQLAERGGVPGLQFLRIVENLATYDNFAGLAEAILASRPDLLLIQTDLGFRERTLLGRYEDYKLYLGRWMRHLVLGAPVEPDPLLRQVTVRCPAGSDGDGLWARVTTYERWLRVDPSGQSFQAVLNLARRAVQAGSDLAFLEIRSSPELRAFYRGTRLDERQALDRMQRESDLPVWRFPSELASSEHYCDYVHLDAAARARFSQWLIGRIAATARARWG